MERFYSGDIVQPQIIPQMIPKPIMQAPQVPPPPPAAANRDGDYRRDSSLFDLHCTLEYFDEDTLNYTLSAYFGLMGCVAVTGITVLVEDLSSTPSHSFHTSSFSSLAPAYANSQSFPTTATWITC